MLQPGQLDDQEKLIEFSTVFGRIEVTITIFVQSYPLPLIVQKNVEGYGYSTRSKFIQSFKGRGNCPTNQLQAIISLANSWMGE